MIKVLDCTLRDGGYVNNWFFGQKNIKRIVNSLNESSVNFIEFGYLDNNGSASPDSTKVSDIDIFGSHGDGNYLCMINYGDYDINKLPEKEMTNIAGIRVAFKKKDRLEAIEYCKNIMQKGYKVFIQPMVSLSYSDIEFVDLIERVNELNPFAFYIVDSFGEMNELDLMRFYYLAENNLSKDIYLGFHSHNNLQLAYSNCKNFISKNSTHNLIVDSSIFGMGRGAGNLNTEIFLDYLNNNLGAHYNINPIIDVIDKVINTIYANHFWGYSVPYYISAKNHCHPNYASFLDDKKTLTFFDIEKIITSIQADKKVSFDKKYIERLYIEYQNHSDKANNYAELESLLKAKTIVLVAPGSTIKNASDIIELEKSKGSIVISINFVPDNFSTDFNFVSNIKRFSKIDNKVNDKLITTTNIDYKESRFKVSYFSLINSSDTIFDNAGLMCIKMLIKVGVKEIKLIGFDGYSYSPNTDYADEELQLAYNSNNKYMNDLMKKQIKKYGEQVPISFLTPSLYEE